MSHEVSLLLGLSLWSYELMAEFVDAPDPAEAEGSEPFVEGGAFRRHRWSEELFSAGFSRVP